MATDMKADLKKYLYKMTQLMLPEELESYVARDIFNRAGVVLHDFQIATPQCLVGDPGSGKTVLLKMIGSQHAHHAGKLDLIPFFFALRQFDKSLVSTDLTAVLARTAFAEPTEPIISQALQHGHALILLDGLDELLPSLRHEFINILKAWLLKYPEARWVLSTRPIAASGLPDEFNMVIVPPFTQREIHELAAKVLPRNMAEGFLAAMNESPMYKKVASNPLFLSLLLSVFCETAILPQRPADFYSLIVDLSLRQWDKLKGLAKSDRYLNSATTLRALSSLALRLLLDRRCTFSAREWSEVCDALGFGESSSSAAVSQTLSEDLLRSIVLTTTPPAQFEFVILGLQNYLAALALTRLPADEAKGILNKLKSPEVASLFGELADDGSPYAEYLIEHGKLDAALRYIEKHGLPDSSRRRLAVLTAAKFGISVVVQDKSTPQTEQEVVRSTIRDMWNRCIAESARYQRGVLFEQFIEQILREAFIIIDRRVSADYGEIDLVCEVKQIDPFWIRWSGDYFIECKNQEANTPVSNVNEFIGKGLAAHSPLCFVISSSQFTTPALDRIARAWSDTGSPDLAWIQREDIEKWLESSESVQDFLKRIVRRAQYGER